MTTRQLFSFDPVRTPACACPHCGWQTFWRYEGVTIFADMQCERCRRWLNNAELVEPHAAHKEG